MSSSNTLTKELLEEEKSAADYLSWVESLIAAVKLEPDGLRKIRYREGLAQELMYEALPIGLLAISFFEASEQVIIRLKVGSQPYDAEVIDGRQNCMTIRYLEVTMALEGEDDYLRLKMLHETGEVSGLTKVQKTRDRKIGLQVQIPREAVSQQEALAREQKKFSEAIDRKAAKTYPPGTMLVVGFDDRIAFDHPENIDCLNSVIDSRRSRLTGFHSVALVGMYKNLLLHWQVSDSV